MKKKYISILKYGILDTHIEIDWNGTTVRHSLDVMLVLMLFNIL